MRICRDWRSAQGQYDSILPGQRMRKERGNKFLCFKGCYRAWRRQIAVGIINWNGLSQDRREGERRAYIDHFGAVWFESGDNCWPMTTEIQTAAVAAARTAFITFLLPETLSASDARTHRLNHSTFPCMANSRRGTAMPVAVVAHSVRAISWFLSLG
jgi:hypothetical protein